MIYSFHPAAEAELNQAVDYYDECQKGLGRNSSRKCIARSKTSLHFPMRGRRFQSSTRRCLSKRFPYGIVYQVAGEEILIIAVMNLSRTPDYWQSRVKKA